MAVALLSTHSKGHQSLIRANLQYYLESEHTLEAILKVWRIIISALPFPHKKIDEIQAAL